MRVKDYMCYGDVLTISTINGMLLTIKMFIFTLLIYRYNSLI